MGDRKPDDRGSITLWAVIVSAALLMIIGLVVDGAGKMRANQRADQVAREAARAAAQALSGDPVLGRPGLIDVSKARVAAQQYLAASDVTGSVSVSGGTVMVTTSVKWQPVMLSVIGVSAQSVDGKATATAKQVYEGAAR